MEAQSFNQAQIKELLNSLGYRLRDDGKAWRARAVYRMGKNENSMSIYKDSGVWSDYGAGLSSQPFGRLLELSGVKNSNIQIEKNPDIVEEIEDAQIERIYPESMLSKLIPHYKFYINKGIDIDCLKRLKGGLAMGGKMYQRYVFPIFNKDGKIFGFSGRYIGADKAKEADKKWKHLGKKRNWVYPLYVKDENGEYFVRDAILKTKEVILVESIGDVLAFHTHGIFNVLIAFGLKCSPATICALIELGVERITIAYNNDFEKGENDNTGKFSSISSFLSLLKYFDFASMGICLPIKKDFGEMNDVDFKNWEIKKASIDYNSQREEICKLAPILLKAKKITQKSYDNMRLLDCA